MLFSKIVGRVSVHTTPIVPWTQIINGKYSTAGAKTKSALTSTVDPYFYNRNSNNLRCRRYQIEDVTLHAGEGRLYNVSMCERPQTKSIRVPSRHQTLIQFFSERKVKEASSVKATLLHCRIVHWYLSIHQLCLASMCLAVRYSLQGATKLPRPFRCSTIV